ncbi:HD-GYP domain-containing protein [Emcibacter sp.]|uniref:HD-GYP domain-containing protein n=1 Tax=Emcibacter sp. TaxID=1979954 RepID=UPI002AA8DC0C|nr:HD domain-containing phosphohydrolase [Emcibacter sp.]
MSANRRIVILRDLDEPQPSYFKICRKYHFSEEHDILGFTMNVFDGTNMIIVQADLARPDHLKILKENILNPARPNIPVLFLLKELNRKQVVQANVLGATDFWVFPCEDEKFEERLKIILDREMEKKWSRLSSTQSAALKVSLKVVEDTFDSARLGLPLSSRDVKNSCDMIIEATSREGLSDWMGAIKNHHNYTYRHCMMVCGYLISFGLVLGMKGEELQQLATGGMLHDIGKARTPLELLDKPGKLTDEEWEIMRRHPEYSDEMLRAQGWDEITIDMAVHHHEKIDGSGYPHGLKGDEFSRYARMTAIADIFSGLTDKRSYKPAMSPRLAMNMMSTWDGHIDQELLEAFRPVALND